MTCSRPQNQEDVLAIVGNRVITRDEFMRRAEYTIRPLYCKLDNNIDKQIILNSIIAEKLYAFEAGEDNPLTRSAPFQAYIRGRKEQFMRQSLFAQIAKDKIKLDESELSERYRLAGREYRLAFCVFNGEVAQFANEAVVRNSDLFDEAYRKSGRMGQAPQKTVAWKSHEIPAVHKALFSEPLQKSQVVGPIQVDTDQFLMLQVLGWIDRSVVTNSEIQQRKDDVYEEWEKEQAKEIWERYILKIMKNKRLDFYRDTFEKMVAMFRPLYIRSNENNIKSFMNADANFELPSALLDSIKVKMHSNNFMDQPFFSFDGRVWTVPDFMKIYASHPLIFRKGKFNEHEFPEQFKFAVVDLMRDQIVNQKAYDQGIDKSPSVQAYTHMWQDALLAGYHQYSYLRARTSNVSSGKALARDIDRYIEHYLNAYSDSLFYKYSEKIRINVPVFESIKLTRIDMVVLNENVPYLEAVPAFPVLTKKSRLDYGCKME